MIDLIRLKFIALANTTLDVLANPGLLAKKSPLATGANPAMAGMAGQCKAGKIYREVGVLIEKETVQKYL